jgi:glutamine---fructose-6-phosphate transaminase (isomerizing)
MTAAASRMAEETAQAPAAVARLLDREAAMFAALGARLAAAAPPLVVTCARGSSDHAAGYLKYLLEILLGVPVASIGPSVASIYRAPLRLRGAVLVTISQSGQSPDLIALQAEARRSGALAVALVNAADSPIAAGADIVVPLHAGVETSVAATKSFAASVAAAAAIAAAWSGNAAMQSALADLPQALATALEIDWGDAEPALAAAHSLYALGRGPAAPIAQEIALKCKETAGIHAEAFSSAEVMHGPLRLIEPGFPVLALVPDDAALAENRAMLTRIEAVSAELFAASALGDLPGRPLAAVRTGFGLLDPVAMILPFYRLIEAVARRRGEDPDRPPRLAKVTETT